MLVSTNYPLLDTFNRSFTITIYYLQLFAIEPLPECIRSQLFHCHHRVHFYRRMVKVKNFTVKATTAAAVTQRSHKYSSLASSVS